MVKLVRFLRVMLVVFRMSGILLVVFVSCNVLFTCLLVAGIKVFPSLLMKKNEKIFYKSNFLYGMASKRKVGRKTLNPQLHSRSATYIKRNGLLIRKTAIKSSHPFQYAYHPLTP